MTNNEEDRKKRPYYNRLKEEEVWKGKKEEEESSPPPPAPYWDKFWEKSSSTKKGHKKKYPESSKTNRDLVEEVAKRASFSKGDVALILRTIRDVLGDWIIERIPFYWAGFFKIYYRATPETTSYSMIEKKVVVRPRRVYPRAKFSVSLNKIEKKRRGTLGIVMMEKEEEEKEKIEQ